MAASALRGVDLDLPKSVMVGLLGASGSGKSTFLNIIGGLDEATAGTVIFEGQELTALAQSGLIRALTYYPATVGRSVEEMIRILTVLQKTDAETVLTPEGWIEGEDVLVPPTQSIDGLFNESQDARFCSQSEH